MKPAKLRDFLDRKVEEYNQPLFIKDDPIVVPHRFTKKQDIEIAAFFAAIFAWGNRTTIINKATELMKMMDDAPHQFIRGHSESELQRMLSFKHRTFNPTDLLYFILFLRGHYSYSDTLETAFSQWMNAKDKDTANALTGFHDHFFSIPDAPVRTKKHIATPLRGSTCKRLNMFLRWMVRKDDRGVDFGLWEDIKPSQLVCPIDVHVARVAKRFGLVDRKQVDWQTAIELTNELKRLDRNDPVKYDFALFGLGVAERF